MREELYQIDVEVKKSTTISERLKNPLSFETESGVIPDYSERLKSVRKFESEKKALEEIQRFHPIENIEKALSYVLKNGTPAKGDSCHSPMAFMASAINEVLSVVQKQEEDERRKREEVSIADLTQKKIEEEAGDRKSEEVAATQEKDFIETFPSENDQNEELLKYLHLFPMMNPKGQVYRKLAVAAWYNQDKWRGSKQ